jgi:heterodisulfide reductase subunit A-like polyferredoxin
MTLGDKAALYAREGWGRKISKEEAIEIARKNEEEGLVLMSGNAQRPSFICACCSDCCGMLGMMKNLPKPAQVVGSNYFAEADVQKCDGCESCVTRCPLDALSVVDDRITIDLARCIGCGLCVPACAENALHLVNKNSETVLPMNEEEFYRNANQYRHSLKGKTKSFAIKSLIRLASRFSK